MRALSVIVYGVFVSLCLFVVLRDLRRRFTLTASALGVYILGCSFGLIYLSYWPAYLPYLGGYMSSPVLESNYVLLRQMISQFITLTIGMVFVVLINVSPKKTTIRANAVFSLHLMALILLSLFAVGVFFYVRYFLHGPGLRLLLTTNLSFPSTQEAVAARMLVRREVMPGQGAYGSFMACVVLFPTIAFLWRYFRLPLHNLFFIFLAFFSLAYAIQTRQKAPILVSALQYLIGFWFSSFVVKHKMFIYLIRVTLIGFLLGFILYVINFGQPLVDAFLSTLGRFFLVPALAEGWWFAAIPDALDYTGPFTFLTISMERIWSVAFAATGNIFSANASFVAVGWSAGGFIGVVLASIVLFGSLMIIDIMGMRIPDRLRLGLYFMTVPAFLAMISGSIMDFYDKGGFVAPLGIITLTLTNLVKKCKSTRQT